MPDFPRLHTDPYLSAMALFGTVCLRGGEPAREDVRLNSEGGRPRRCLGHYNTSSMRSLFFFFLCCGHLAMLSSLCRGDTDTGSAAGDGGATDGPVKQAQDADPYLVPEQSRAEDLMSAADQLEQVLSQSRETAEGKTEAAKPDDTAVQDDDRLHSDAATPGVVKTPPPDGATKEALALSQTLEALSSEEKAELNELRQALKKKEKRAKTAVYTTAGISGLLAAYLAYKRIRRKPNEIQFRSQHENEESVTSGDGSEGGESGPFLAGLFLFGSLLSLLNSGIFLGGMRHGSKGAVKAVREEYAQKRKMLQKALEAYK